MGYFITSSNTLHTDICRYGKTGKPVEVSEILRAKACKVCKPVLAQEAPQEEIYMDEEIKQVYPYHVVLQGQTNQAPAPRWVAKLVRCAPWDAKALKKEGFFAACDYTYALRGWASSGIKPTLAQPIRNYKQEIEKIVQILIWGIEYAQKADASAKILRAKNAERAARAAEKAARAAKSRAWAEQEIFRRKAAQERAAKAKAKRETKALLREIDFVLWKLDGNPDATMLNYAVHIENERKAARSLRWDSMAGRFPGDGWGEVTTQVDEGLAAFNRKAREARAAAKAYAEAKAAARKARRIAHKGMGGGKCEAFQTSAKKKAWQKGEKRALKSLLRKQRKAAILALVKVKVTKEVTRQAPWSAKNRQEWKMLRVAARIAGNTAVSIRNSAQDLVAEPKALDKALRAEGEKVLGLIADWRKGFIAIQDAEKALEAVKAREALLFMDFEKQVIAGQAARTVLAYVYSTETRIADQLQGVLMRAEQLKPAGEQLFVFKARQGSDFLLGQEKVSQRQHVTAKIKSKAAELFQAEQELNALSAEIAKTLTYISELAKRRIKAGVVAKTVQAFSDDWMAAIEKRIAEINVQRNALRKNRKMETVTVDYYVRVTKKAAKAMAAKQQTVDVDLGKMVADPVSVAKA